MMELDPYLLSAVPQRTNEVVMNRTSFAALSFVLGSALLGCGGEKKPADTAANAPVLAPAELPPAPTNPDAGAPLNSPGATNETAKPDAGAGGASAAKPDTLNDEQIAGITDAANSAEIEQGKLARLKSKDAAVQKFAAKMIAAHEEAKKNQDKLKLPTAESALGNSLGTEAASALSTLKTAEGKDFDKAYIDAQVSEHQKLLDALNDKLIPSVKNPDLKAYLNQILPHVGRHLQEAQEIQRTVASNAPSAPAASGKGANSGAKPAK
jgi:putative membrane protein